LKHSASTSVSCEDTIVFDRLKNISCGFVCAVFMFGMSQTASAQSTASDSLGLANNLVTQTTAAAASTQVAGIVGTAVAAAIAPPVGAPPVVSQNGYDGKITSYFNSRQTGVSAGNAPKSGFWVQGGYTSVEGTDTGGEFDGDVMNFLVGADFKPNSKSVVGVAIGYEDLDIDTTFNNGTFTGSGFGITPYFGLTLSPSVSVQVLAGWSSIEYDATRNTGAITSSFDADRVFGSASLTGNVMLSKNLNLAPKATILYVSEDQDSTTDSSGVAVASQSLDLGRISFGGTLSYMGDKAAPYVRVMGEYDYQIEDAVDLGNGNFSSNDDTGIAGAVGVNLSLGNGLYGNLEVSSSSILRDNLDVYTYTGRIRYNW
jgi:hypothetical protein